MFPISINDELNILKESITDDSNAYDQIVSKSNNFIFIYLYGIYNVTV
jgi:hypothetical protein